MKQRIFKRALPVYSLFWTFQQLTVPKHVRYKIRCLDSKSGHMVLQATAMPLPKMAHFAGSVPASKLLLFAQKNWGRRNGSSRGTFKFHVTLSSKMLKKFPPPSLSLLELKVVLRNNWSFNSAEFHLEFVINFEHPK